MTDERQNWINGLVEKASNHLEMAKDHLKSHVRVSEAIQAAQECTELSVKAVLGYLEINFPRTHGWDEKQLAEIAKQIAQRQILARLRAHLLQHSIRLPRLLFLANFWHQFYLHAKYGMEVGNLAAAKDLFEKDDAELAVTHAKECYNAAHVLRYLNPKTRSAIVAGSTP